MLLFQLAILSPIIMIGIAIATYASARTRRLPKASGGLLLVLSLVYGVLGAIASLVWTIFWMQAYEAKTGYSAGNGPLGWIFFYGPVSFALGQGVALVHWWYKKPMNRVGGHADVA
jgi:hypothetical protein